MKIGAMLASSPCEECRGRPLLLPLNLQPLSPLHLSPLPLNPLPLSHLPLNPLLPNPPSLAPTRHLTSIRSSGFEFQRFSSHSVPPSESAVSYPGLSETAFLDAQGKPFLCPSSLSDSELFARSRAGCLFDLFKKPGAYNTDSGARSRDVGANWSVERVTARAGRGRLTAGRSGYTARA